MKPNFYPLEANDRFLGAWFTSSYCGGTERDDWFTYCAGGEL